MAQNARTGEDDGGTLGRIPRALEEKFGRNWDRQTKQDKLDRFIQRTFPSFVVIGIIMTLIMVLVNPNGLSLKAFLLSLCWSYILVFLFIGFISMAFSESDVVKAWYTFPVLLGAATLIAITLWLTFGTSYGLNSFIAGFFNFVSTSAEINFSNVLLSIYLLTAIVVLDTYGGMAVAV